MKSDSHNPKAYAKQQPRCTRLKTLLTAAAAIAVLAWHPAAISQRFACNGLVDNITLPRGSVVNASFVFENGQMLWQDICSVSSDHRGITASTCRALYATLLAAHLNNRTITMWFEHPSLSCSKEAWGDLSDLGWYWGPALRK